MDLLKLEHFLAVAAEGNLTRAAERVCPTQPAVSQSIKKLEDEIGAPLFARDVHDITLTDAGNTLLDYANRMVRLRDDAMRELAALRNLDQGMLSIAAHESAAVYLLPAPLRTYLTRFPDVKIGIYRSPLAEIPRQVMDREVHVGFVKDEPSFHELQCVEVPADEMSLVAAPRHPLAERPNLHVRDLGGERFVVHHLCSSTEQKILRLFEQHRTPCRIAAELWSFENVKSFVLAEVGMAIVPRITVAQELRDRALVQIPVAELDMPRRTMMIYREQGYLSQAARELIKIVRSFNWDSKVIPTSRRSAAAESRAAAA
jgi:DNA-binding transcriptional LysR family regulator